MKKQKLSKGTVFAITITVCVAIFALFFVTWYVVGYYPTKTMFPDNPEKAAQFGDSFGYVNSLLSGLALIAATIAIILQTIELRYQREEMDESQATWSAQADAMLMVAYCQAISQSESLEQQIAIRTIRKVFSERHTSEERLSSTIGEPITKSIDMLLSFKQSGFDMDLWNDVDLTLLEIEQKLESIHGFTAFEYSDRIKALTEIMVLIRDGSLVVSRSLGMASCLLFWQPLVEKLLWLEFAFQKDNGESLRNDMDRRFLPHAFAGNNDREGYTDALKIVRASATEENIDVDRLGVSLSNAIILCPSSELPLLKSIFRLKDSDDPWNRLFQYVATQLTA